MKKIKIDGREIGEEFSPYIVAELSANHNGSIDTALESISMAKRMGADAIKLQTYTADTMTIDSSLPDFQIKGGLWDGYSLYDLYSEAGTPYDWHKTIFDYARKIGITCFSTPFDESAVDLLEDLNTPAYKIASFEVLDLPLIKYVAQTKKPMIISTGMADLQEIEEAVDTARTAGCKELILLHCISSYPAPIEESNIRTIRDLQKRFDTVVGLSDHSLGVTASISAVALGASFIEKHFTLDRGNKGPDSEFSIEPSELKLLTESAKDAWLSIGVNGYSRKPSEEDNVRFRRSLYFVNDLKAGSHISEKDIRRIRPGYGLAPRYLDKVIGSTLNRDVVRGTAVSWDDINV